MQQADILQRKRRRMKEAKPWNGISWKISAVCAATALWKVLEQVFSDKGPSLLPTAIYSAIFAAFVYWAGADLQHGKRN
ncbi:hypothetical protein [Streptomyces sp. SLBN-118]|uniref:hypothetical protein n=1 Tax=Streptomyces sp. SLBN-118 TaxID=2768454 RepID=UPI00114FC499|nr:hypothetical protein [Streptomyces sp. SLBN-118]